MCFNSVFAEFCSKLPLHTLNYFVSLLNGFHTQANDKRNLSIEKTAEPGQEVVL